MLSSFFLLLVTFAGVLAAPVTTCIGDNNGWTVTFASTAWSGNDATAPIYGTNLYYTGQPGCSGLQELTSTGTQPSSWTLSHCFSNTGADGDMQLWNITIDAPFTATSVTSNNALADLRLFYWSTNATGAPLIRDAYLNVSSADAEAWVFGELELVVNSTTTGSLAATTWVSNGTVGRTVFYLQDGWLKEMTLLDGLQWDNQGREGIELGYTAGEISAVSWVDATGVLNKRVYVENQDTQLVVEYAWSNATPFTSAANLYPTPTTQSNAARMAAALSVLNDTPTLYMWTTGPNGGVVTENGAPRGSNVKAGSQLAAASQSGGGSNFVFFLDGEGRLVMSCRDPEGEWHEDLPVTVAA